MRKYFLFVIIFAAIILLSPQLKTFADDTGNPYSNKNASNIGAWYDETWEANGFYRLQRIGASNDFQYVYTPTATTNATPTFTQPGTLKNTATEPDTTTATPHQHDYKHYTSGTSLPQDMVVTEWKVSGHVHFKSQL